MMESEEGEEETRHVRKGPGTWRQQQSRPLTVVDLSQLLVADTLEAFKWSNVLSYIEERLEVEGGNEVLRLENARRHRSSLGLATELPYVRDRLRRHPRRSKRW